MTPSVLHADGLLTMDGCIRHDAAHLAPSAAQSVVAVPAAKGVVRHQDQRRRHHEAAANPQGVGSAPKQLAQCLRNIKSGCMTPIVTSDGYL
jgi:hypothetical protein